MINYNHCDNTSSYPNIISNNYSHDDSINSHCLTEDNTNEIFCFDTRGFHSTTQDTDTSCENTPVNKKFDHYTDIKTQYITTFFNTTVGIQSINHVA